MILSIGIKEPTTTQQILEAIPGQQLTVKLNMVHTTAYLRDKNIVRTNIQENRSIFNQIRHIQAIRNKLTTLPTKPPVPDHISDVHKSPFYIRLA